MTPPRMGSEDSLGVLGWGGTQLQVPRSLSGLQIWTSGQFSVPVRGEGQALGPCASLTKGREMAKDPFKPSSRQFSAASYQRTGLLGHLHAIVLLYPLIPAQAPCGGAVREMLQGN